MNHSYQINQNGAEQFWLLADALQEKTLSHANELFSFSETASEADLKSMLIQYRFFTIYYIPDLAILIARMKAGKLRSLLADILSDELGFGDPAKAHPRLYDDFLNSLDIPDTHLDDLALKDNLALLDNIRAQLVDPSFSAAHGVGLRGMGGECVCQIYLSKFYEHIIKNPYIQARKDKIDWRFWDLHVGEHDIEHRIKTRKMINEEIVVHGQEPLMELTDGFKESMNAWSQFWNNVFKSVKQQDMQRMRVMDLIDFSRISSAAYSKKAEDYLVEEV